MGTTIATQYKQMNVNTVITRWLSPVQQKDITNILWMSLHFDKSLCVAESPCCRDKEQQRDRELALIKSALYHAVL